MGSPETSHGSRQVDCHRRDGQKLAPTSDTVIAEEPLELRVDGTALATIMRTPGHDQELALGFFFSEGWISSRVDVGSLACCARETSAQAAPDSTTDSAATASPETPLGNVVDLLSPEGRRHEAPTQRLPVSSSCGVCGKRTIDEVLARTPLVEPTAAPAAPPDGVPAQSPAAENTTMRFSSTILGLPAALQARQVLFDKTGSVHAAGLFRSDGKNLVVREDVGRHNAVDKVVGWALLEGAFPLSGVVLQVSGRTSFEIVQKAHAAGIRIICGVSGVSSLAIELAERASITLVGFVRGTDFTVYTHPDRLVHSANSGS